ncbi:MAG: GNAT family N-acetyltransferase [Kineosporiaceae bacterium]
MVTVRVARDEELDGAGRVVVEAYRADGIGNAEYLATVADARSRASSADVAVAVNEGGEVLGSVTFCLPGSPWAELSRPGEAEFRMLGVSPAARGQGVGEALVRWCLDRGRAEGVSTVVISSQDVMAAAHRLYDRLGFTRRPDLDWSPVPGVHLLGFERPLG